VPFPTPSGILIAAVRQDLGFHQIQTSAQLARAKAARSAAGAGSHSQFHWAEWLQESITDWTIVDPQNINQDIIKICCL